ncbi:di-heme oxidoredictase family protein [Hymenobacter koreensis]|uniref:Di-heme oxidoredictase family protein n=1 Tax=Hymenobacter koreensis TaxID=1084523 RepID=A0ABP8JC90_9BACT
MKFDSHMSKPSMRLSGLAAVWLLLASCELIFPQAPADDAVLDGPVAGLTPEQHAQFLRGDVAFNDEVFTSRTGLGPVFVAASCGSCHAGDGKGHPTTTLTRFGQVDSTGNLFLQRGGPQLQHRALPGFQPEQLPAGAAHSRFTPPANTGLGFLDAVPDAALLALADPNDADGDGISGRPNWISAPGYITARPGTRVQAGRYIGRYGKKAAAYDLLHQTAAAYNQDMGIVSSYEAVDAHSGQLADPEVSNQTVLDVVAYLKMLKAPVQREPNHPDVLAGEQAFLRIGCGKCHTPQLTTGASPIAALAHQTVRPYTDLLLHDMGPGLNDGYTEGTAAPAEWRTPALWGLGLSPNSQGGTYFLLHDGRARSIEDAIRQHGGEGQPSRERFDSLSAEQQRQLVRFLQSL